MKSCIQNMNFAAHALHPRIKVMQDLLTLRMFSDSKPVPCQNALISTLHVVTDDVCIQYEVCHYSSAE